MLTRAPTRRTAPRISIGERLVADLLVTAGANRILTMTLHSPRVYGFFNIPVDHLHALRELAGHFKQYDLANTVVVSPDLGNAKAAAAFARLLGTTVAAAAKQRFSDDHVEISAIIGDVAGRDIIVLDDEIAGGSTVIERLKRLRRRDARSALIACTHGLFSAGALDRLNQRHDVLDFHQHRPNNLFDLRRDHVTAAEHRAARMLSFRVWAEISSVAITI